MTEFWAYDTWSEDVSYPVQKYDDQTGKVSAQWKLKGTLAQEPRFIPNPHGTSEDDGLLVVIAYNFLKETTSFYVIDAKSMETLQEYPLPFKLS